MRSDFLPRPHAMAWIGPSSFFVSNEILSREHEDDEKWSEVEKEEEEEEEEEEEVAGVKPNPFPFLPFSLFTPQVDSFSSFFTFFPFHLGCV